MRRRTKNTTAHAVDPSAALFAVGLVRLILDLVVLHPFQPAVQQN